MHLSAAGGEPAVARGSGLILRAPPDPDARVLTASTLGASGVESPVQTCKLHGFHSVGRDRSGEGDAAELYAAPSAQLEAVNRMGIEGIVSKRRNSLYRSGPTRDWIKVKTAAWCAANDGHELFGKASRRHSRGK